MIEAQKLNEGLAHFYGTQQYHRWSGLFKTVLTDGAKYLAEQAQCYWLMDVIASHLPKPVNIYPFVVAKLKKNKHDSFSFSLEDGNYNVISSQEIEYSDFPLDEYELFVQYSGDAWVIMLTSEY